MIEGLWAQIKRWLPRAGSYNLTEYLDLFQWFYQQKLNGKNPFWRLLELMRKLILDIDGEDGDDDEEEAEGEQEDEYESDEEEHYWYDCPWCKEIWFQEKSRDDHMVICSQRI